MEAVGIGVLLAFGAAISKGVQSVYQKRSVTETDEFVTAWSSRFFGIPLLALAVAVNGVPAIESIYVAMLGLGGAIITVTSILIAKAYKYTDVSLVDPIYAFSPALLLFTSPLILGDFPSRQGVIGVLLITAGAYFLKTGGDNILDPIRNLFRERGVQLIFIVVVLYSISANFDKIGLQASSPVFWGFSIYAAASLLLFPVMARHSSGWRSRVRASWKPLATLGFLGSISIIFQMLAFSETLVPYVISIKRLSIPVAVVLGSVIFDEENLGGRLFGSAVMVVGAILISLA